jgi:hypothetical protein
VVKAHLRKYQIPAGHERVAYGNFVLRVGLLKITHNSMLNHLNHKNKPWKDKELSTYLFDPNGL